MTQHILCVDEVNDGLATAAEAYLEILRVWTINTTPDRHVLFSASTSAGVYIKTAFTETYSTKGAPLKPDKSVIPEIKNKNLRALDVVLKDKDKLEKYGAEETKYIMARAANRKIQGLERTNFDYYEYILCFDTKVEKELKHISEALKQEWIDDSPKQKEKPTAGIICLTTHYDEKNLVKSLTNLMGTLEHWVQNTFQYNSKSWKVPEKPMTGGTWRTKQVWILKSQLDTLRKVQNGKSEWDEIVAKTQCTLNSSWGRLYGTRLLTISGKPADLENAVKTVETFWLAES